MGRLFDCGLVPYLSMLIYRQQDAGLNNSIGPSARIRPKGPWGNRIGGGVARQTCVFGNSGNPNYPAPNRHSRHISGAHEFE